MSRLTKEIVVDASKDTFTVVDAVPLSLRPEALAHIEANWVRLNGDRTDLFNSTLLRFIGVVEVDGEARVSVAPDIDYKLVTGLRYGDGIHPAAIDDVDLFQAMSCYLCVYANDGTMLFIERNSGDWGKALDMPGGFIPHSYNIDDVAEFARRRTKSDLSLLDEHFSSISLLGMYDYPGILEMMMVYRVDLTLSMDEVAARSSRAVYAVPADYSTDRHDDFFPMKMHVPAQPVIATFFGRTGKEDGIIIDDVAPVESV